MPPVASRRIYGAVKRQPALHPRELEHQLKDSGASDSSSLKILRFTLQQGCLPEQTVKHVCVATMGDLLRIEGHLVNFVVRKASRKLVPAWSLPGHVSFKAALRCRTGKTSNRLI